MIKRQEGSLVIVMLGLFWLAGIITAVLYAITAHLFTLVMVREIQTRYWYLMQGGMVTALAHMNESPDLFVQSKQSLVLYEGPWRIDPRHATLKLKISTDRVQESDQAHCRLVGELFESKKCCVIIVWYLAYDEIHKKWGYRYAERTNK